MSDPLLPITTTVSGRMAHMRERRRPSLRRMGRWLDGAEPREMVRANHSRGFLNVGGRLAVTESHVVFLPNALDRWLGFRAWTCPIAEIRRVGVAPRGRPGRLFGGGIRRRLVMHHTNGSEYFVVTDVESVVARFGAVLGLAVDGAA